MPKILTKVYKNALFFLPYSRDKSEGVWCKPLTMTKRNELRRQAQIEAGSPFVDNLSILAIVFGAMAVFSFMLAFIIAVCKEFGMRQ